jgi:hypothetical protein
MPHYGAPKLRRLALFAKGNVDVHDSLHSCVIDGDLCWNGVNEIVRQRHPGTLIRLKHETWTRSDAVLRADGAAPPEIATRNLPLGVYPPSSQFSAALFNSEADAFVMSILPETATRLFRHRRSGYLLYPNDLKSWSAADRDWFKAEFEDLGLLDVAESIANFERIIDLIRLRSDAPILIYNMSPVVPGEMVHCFQGLGDTYSTRVRRFNLALAELSERTGVSIIDVDTLLARAGADRLKLDVMHLAPEGYRLIAEEVVRVLEDLAVFESMEEPKCAPV